ncbi:MAG: hypothetical protein WCA51_06500 [Dehalococcoidia bacterium]
MLSSRFNLVEQLNVTSAQVSSKGSHTGKNNSFDNGNIPEVFHRMYDVANELASREGLLWIQVKHAQDAIDTLESTGRRGTEGEGKEPLAPLLQTQLYEFVVARREEYLKRMTSLLELYAKSRWAHGENQARG